MLDLRAEANLRTFETPEVARHYASLGYVTPCERLLFDCYIKPESDILDLGVGGRRTTKFLASGPPAMSAWTTRQRW